MVYELNEGDSDEDDGNRRGTNGEHVDSRFGFGGSYYAMRAGKVRTEVALLCCCEVVLL